MAGRSPASPARLPRAVGWRDPPDHEAEENSSAHGGSGLRHGSPDQRGRITKKGPLARKSTTNMEKEESSRQLIFQAKRQGRRITRDGPLLKNAEGGMGQDMTAVIAKFAASSPPSDISKIEDGTYRAWLGHLLYSPIAEATVAAAIAFNFLLTIVETDARATGGHAGAWVSIAGRTCLGIFTAELSIRALVERRKLLRSNWNRLDMAIVVTGIVELVLEEVSDGSSVSLSMLRIARLLRLGRTLKSMSSLREVKYLVNMMITCMRTLFWSFILTFLLLTMWSLMIVEFVHPLVHELVEDDPGCESMAAWSLAFSSVMRSNLTLFQTIVAGDSWGRVAVPIIVGHPWTALLFLPALITIVFGVLNLIVAVVVDSAAEARQGDDSARAEARTQEEIVEKKALREIFDLIDADNSGALTFDELECGVDCIPAFRDRLRGMDVGKDDLQELYALLDDDGNGEVDPKEFIEVLYRMKCVNSNTSLTLVKHYVTNIKKQMSIIMESVGVCMDALGAKLPTPDLSESESGAEGNDSSDNFISRVRSLSGVSPMSSPSHNAILHKKETEAARAEQQPWRRAPAADECHMAEVEVSQDDVTVLSRPVSPERCRTPAEAWSSAPREFPAPPSRPISRARPQSAAQALILAAETEDAVPGQVELPEVPIVLSPGDSCAVLSWVPSVDEKLDTKSRQPVATAGAGKVVSRGRIPATRGRPVVAAPRCTAD